MRQTLPKDKSDEIRASLPDLDTRCFLATTSSPALDKYDLDNATTRHISLVCLGDAFRRMRFALDSLFESQACATYYREVAEAEMDNDTKEFFAIRNFYMQLVKI
jgi:hypothetical protein